MTEYVVELSAADAEPELVGGKAAGLARLSRAGFAVPPGFVVTVAAYRVFAGEALPSRIGELLRPVPPGDPVALNAAAARIREAVVSTPIPQALAGSIVAAYRRLGTTAHAAGRRGSGPLPVAVRSSTTAEDSAELSFAGQHDSFLNVRGEAALLDAVRRCWASRWTARALSYAAHQGGTATPRDAGVAPAILVQEFVPARAAGVLFTRAPLTGADDEMLVNAVWGLGETVVGGQATPDSIVTDKATGRTKKVLVACKDTMAVPAASGTRLAPVPRRRRRSAVLDQEQAAELTRLGVAVEQHQGAAQDIEWAILDDGRVVILQTRPITRGPARSPAAPDRGLPPVPGDDDWPVQGTGRSHDFDIWTRANVGELWPDPVSPLVASVAPEIITSAVRHSFRSLREPFLDEISWARRIHGRIYYNEGALVHLLEHKLGLPPGLMDRARGNSGFTQPRESRVHPWRLLRHLPTLARLATRQRGTARELRALIPRIDRWVAEFDVRSHDGLTDAELWAAAQLWLTRTSDAMKLQNDMSGVSLTAIATLERLTTRWFGRPEVTYRLIGGLSGIRSAELGAALSRIAHAIREAGLVQEVLGADAVTALSRLRELPAAEPVLRLLDEFLHRHGYRCANESEWLHPRWRDAPELVVELLAGYLTPGKDDLAMSAALQQRHRAEALAWANARLGPVRRRIFRSVLSRAHDSIRLRDNGKDAAIKASYPARQIAVHFGRLWAGRGWLSAANDVFFLTVDDIVRVIRQGSPGAAGLDLVELVRLRRQAFTAWFDIEAPDVVGADGSPLSPSSSVRDASPGAVRPGGRPLTGIAASAGSVQGTARIVLDPRAAARIQRGEILVTRSTDVGWTAVFPLLGGLISEIGGQLSHSAILAREYGLPAVVNVPGATKLIKEGQLVRLDGLTGQIHLLEGSPAVTSSAPGPGEDR
ncbi:PEP/pyruvate-binding domain-containing protein [Nonomuraea sp. NPDC051191]|uniref:PEP/pyruvate-binding domain-containing protein n=1 Tax=Nonomuraea sp. NPDC051191 TaxID=3364372 RepID=UPI0037A22C3B